MPDIELSDAIGRPPILRGTVSASRWEGVVPGAGVPSGDRKRNAHALQDALDHAAQNNNFFELEPGIYQIERSEGLVVPAGEGGFVWRGSKGSHIQQFTDNAPVLTIGNVMGNAMLAHADIRGFRLSYGTDQSANPGASALRLGLVRNSILENIAILADYGASGPRIKAYRGIEVINKASSFGFFSNTVKDVMVAGASRHLLDMALVGTGSVFQNIYLTQGITDRPAPIGREALRVAGNADLYESVFENVNIEWCVANVLVLLQNCRATSFIGCHLEGNRIEGRDPRVMQISTSQLNFTGLNILDLEVDKGWDSRDPQIFGFYGDCAISGSNIHLSWSGAGKAKNDFYVCGPNRYNPPDERQTVSLVNVTVRDVGGDNVQHLALDPGLPHGQLPVPAVIERFASRADGLCRVEGARLASNADITVHAQLIDPYLEFPATLGAARTVTLSNRMKPAGDGAALTPQSGAIVTVRRNTGTADAYALVVKNHDGKPLETISAAATTKRFQFDGANWISAG